MSDTIMRTSMPATQLNIAEPTITEQYLKDNYTRSEIDGAYNLHRNRLEMPTENTWNQIKTNFFNGKTYPEKSWDLFQRTLSQGIFIGRLTTNKWGQVDTVPVRKLTEQEWKKFSDWNDKSLYIEPEKVFPKSVYPLNVYSHKDVMDAFNIGRLRREATSQLYFEHLKRSFTKSYSANGWKLYQDALSKGKYIDDPAKYVHNNVMRTIQFLDMSIAELNKFDDDKQINANPIVEKKIVPQSEYNIVNYTKKDIDDAVNIFRLRMSFQTLGNASKALSNFFAEKTYSEKGKELYLDAFKKGNKVSPVIDPVHRNYVAIKVTPMSENEKSHLANVVHTFLINQGGYPNDLPFLSYVLYMPVINELIIAFKNKQNEALKQQVENEKKILLAKSLDNAKKINEMVQADSSLIADDELSVNQQVLKQLNNADELAVTQEIPSEKKSMKKPALIAGGLVVAFFLFKGE